MFANIKQIFAKRNKDLRKRILFTLGALMIFIIGTNIKVPNTPDSSKDLGFLELLNVIGGGALKKSSILSSIKPNKDTSKEYIAAKEFLKEYGDILDSDETSEDKTVVDIHKMQLESANSATEMERDLEAICAFCASNEALMSIYDKFDFRDEAVKIIVANRLCYMGRMGKVCTARKGKQMGRKRRIPPRWCYSVIPRKCKL